MKTHTTHVSEATETMAFITDQDNVDIAVIKRCAMSANGFDDAAWHRWLSLIDSAPKMLDALQRITHPMAGDDDVENALAVLATAKLHYHVKRPAL